MELSVSFFEFSTFEINSFSPKLKFNKIAKISFSNLLSSFLESAPLF